MQITDLQADDVSTVEQLAELLVEAFAVHWPMAWPNVEAGRAEVLESLAPGRISRVARDSKGRILGWIGAIPEYDGNVFELHPLVVRPDSQRRGIGRALVQNLEEQ
ncbi:MAG: GNAT family N-acetyltransferase, partial [Candidatus Promineifilaceae bacterium]|nr:GNAT family N-acetyltransferase [Candidatus Promineifilaceae bacterium]